MQRRDTEQSLGGQRKSSKGSNRPKLNQDLSKGSIERDQSIDKEKLFMEPAEQKLQTIKEEQNSKLESFPRLEPEEHQEEEQEEKEDKDDYEEDFNSPNPSKTPTPAK